MSAPRVAIFLRKIVENNFKQEKKIISKYFSTKPGELVLDLGCGTGEFSPMFPRDGYVGIDISPANIEYASRHYQKKFLVADGKRLPFADGYFSKVLVVGVFHHLSESDLEKVMSEIRRVLKPQGRLLVMEDTRCNNPVITFLQSFDQGAFVRTGSAWKEIFFRGWNIEESFAFRSGLSYYSAFLLKNP